MTSARMMCFLAVAVMLVATCELAWADFYVSTSGNDANSGAKDQPFRSIEHARDCAGRQIKQAAASRVPITVWINGGTYYCERTLELTAEDSGMKESPVVYRAEPGADVRLVGGRQIPPDAFKRTRDAAVLDRLDTAARGHVLQADLKALGVTNLGEAVRIGKRPELFFNDKPLTLARWPNEGFVKIGEVTGGQPLTIHGFTGDKVGKFTYDDDRPNRWAAEPEIWLEGYWFWDWSHGYQRVESITRTRTINLAQPYHNYGYRKGQRYAAVNLLAELDRPGEWYLDRRTGVLYLWPPGPMEKARIVLSLLESPVVRLRNTSYLVLRELTIEATRGRGVEISGGEGNLIAGCTIRNVGQDGVSLSVGKSNGVSGCEIYQMGAGAIYVNGGDRRTLSPSGNFAVNNHIHHFGRLQRTYAAAIYLDGVGNRAANNLIHDAPHWAIGFGGNENVMELNEIHDVCQETGDVGVFYTGRDWTVRGNVIRHNFIHHVSGPGVYGAQGVYLDDCASGTIVFGNMIYKTSCAMLIGGGRDNTIENNVMLDCHESIHFDNRGLNWMQDHVVAGGIMPQRLAAIPYRQPPWSDRYPQLLNLLNDEPGAPKGNVIRLNVVCRCKPMSLAKEVSQFGTIADNLTTNDDLGFQDAGNMDFKLRDDSVVFKKLPKFQNILFEKIGLYKDEYRNDIPVKHRPK